MTSRKPRYSIASFHGAPGGFGEYNTEWRDENFVDLEDAFVDLEHLYITGDENIPEDVQELMDDMTGNIHNEPDVLFAVKIYDLDDWQIFGYNEI